ncbi:MAG: hypothetical protein Q4G68_06620 [Planctomycetia bacterium]|nr:hypothetical protein [Planctomycetia bacterium]
MEVCSRNNVIEGCHRRRTEKGRSCLNKMNVILALLAADYPPHVLIKEHGFSKHYVYRLRYELGLTVKRSKKPLQDQPKRKRKRRKIVLQLQLAPKAQARYMQVLAYRRWCRANNAEWTSDGLRRFLKRFAGNEQLPVM